MAELNKLNLFWSIPLILNTIAIVLNYAQSNLGWVLVNSICLAYVIFMMCIEW